MERRLNLHRNIRLILVFLLLNALLTGCVPETDQAKTSGGGAPDGTTVSAVQSVAVSHWGHRVHFPEIAPKLLTGSDTLSPYLRVRFDSKDPFNASYVSFAVNGVRPRCGNDWNLSRASTWSLEGGEWVLWIDLNRLAFAGGIPVWLHLRRVQGWGGKVQVWVRGPHPVLSAEIIFRDRKTPPPNDLPKPPAVKITSAEPAGAIIYTTSIVMRFEGNDTAVGFRCSLDGSSWKGCASPLTWKGLSKGKHTFRVKALDRFGRVSDVVQYQFKRGDVAPYVVIKQVSPDVSPTNSDTLKVDFEVSSSNLLGWESLLKVLWRTECQGRRRVPEICKWIADNFHGSSFWAKPKAFCSVDGSAFSPCASPLVLKNLTEGGHRLEIRAHPNHKLEQAAHYAWVVDRKIPQLEWTETPALETDERTGRFAFLASEEATFRCSVDGGSASVCESPFVIENLAQGTHRVEVRATDAAGNQATPLIFVWRVITSRPTLTVLSIVPGETLTAARDIAISFQASRPAVFHCFFDVARPTEVGPDEELCESPFVAADLADGTHQVHIIARDMAGNLSDWFSYQWEVDTVPPELTLAMTSPASVPTSSTEATFEFSAPGAVSFRCSLDGGAQASCVSPTHVTGLASGTHRFSVTAIDGAGNTADATQFAWVVDTIVPVVQLTRVVPSESPTVLRSITVDFTASEAVSFFRCNLDRAGDTPCQSPFFANDLADGNHRLEIYAVDAAANVSDTAVYAWDVYSEAFVQIDSITPSQTLTSSGDIVFTFSSAAGSGFVCSLDGSTPASCVSPQAYASLSDGSHVFQVQARNGVGGLGPVAEYRWDVDATAPSLSLGTISPNYSPTPLTTISISFSASESVTFYCSVDDDVAQPCPSPFVTGVSDGDHTFEVYAEDAAGNRSQTLSHSWSVDSRPLTLTNISAANITRTGATISWDSNLPATGQVGYGVGEPSQTTPVISVYTSGHTVDLTGLTPNTLYTYQVISVDMAGRTARSTLRTFRTLR